VTIDGQLAEAGWLIQSCEEMNRSAGQPRAEPACLLSKDARF
jgi:hypothetical protein